MWPKARRELSRVLCMDSSPQRGGAVSGQVEPPAVVQYSMSRHPHTSTCGALMITPRAAINRSSINRFLHVIFVLFFSLLMPSLIFLTLLLLSTLPYLLQALDRLAIFPSYTTESRHPLNPFLGDPPSSFFSHSTVSTFPPLTSMYHDIVLYPLSSHESLSSTTRPLSKCHMLWTLI